MKNQIKYGRKNYKLIMRLVFLLVALNFYGILRSQSCCDDHAGVGCGDLNCQTAVCNIDPWCCNTQWDGFCASEAVNNANNGGPCSGTAGCPTFGGGNGGCNTDISICDNNSLAGPFTFDEGSANPSSCLVYTNGATAPNYAYITLYITQGGALNLLINGDQATGCVDVAIFDITNSNDPCNDLSSGTGGTEISCNFASDCDGCAQFGTEFNCDSDVPAPNVNAGDVIMILVEDYTNNQNSFTLDLANTPGSAQTGPPDATITQVGPFCDDAASVQLDAVNMGGTWIGPGVDANGLFDPATAGVGTHTIEYSIGSAPCDDQDQVTIEVNDCSACFMTFLSTDISACDPADNTFEITGTVEFDTPPATGQLIVEDCNGNQQTFNAPFNSPTNYTLGGINSDGTQNCEITAYFSDDPSCEITSNPFDYPVECACETEIGSFNDGVVGNSNSNGNPYYLCFDDEFDIIGDGSFVPPQDFNLAGVTYDPGVWLFVYECAPTIFEPDDLLNDPCLLGVASTANQAWTIINNGGGYDNLFFMPVTMYSMVDNTYAISLNNGDWCYETGPVYDITFLDEITTNIVEDCQAGTAEVTISGGMPGLDGSNFTLTNLQPASANLSSNTVGNNGTVTISGLEDGDNYSFDIEDGTGCVHSISGTFEGLEDPSFDYPASEFCNTQTNPSANITGDPGGTFSVAPAGLNVDPNSGLIDLSSATGTFTITYQTPDPVCFDTQTFEVTIFEEPILNTVNDEVVCDQFTLQAISGTILTGNEAYYTDPNGGGTQFNAGDVINFNDFPTYPVTIYVYDETGTTPNCSDETSFELTILETPNINPIADQFVCDEFILPAITGTNLTGNEAFYDAPNGGGNQLNPGDVLSTVGVHTIYIYDESVPAQNCFDEEVFEVTISLTPEIDQLANQEECDQYQLPAITGNNLTGNEAYFDEPNGAGNQFNSGDVITDAGTNTFYIYDEAVSNPNCFDEETFDVTINLSPEIDPVNDQFVCDEYTLPNITGNNLTGNESFYDAPNGGGNLFNSGDIITNQGVNIFYIYDETNTTPNCSDETSFEVSINITPEIDSINDIIECDQTSLPAISGTNLTGNESFYDAPNGVGNQFNPGDVFNTPGTTTIYVYDETGGNPNCSDEINFDITINVTPDFTVSYTDPTECGTADGVITLEGLEPNTTYDVTYEFGGTNIGPNNFASDANGDIEITGLAVGSYSNFLVELNGCQELDPNSLNLEEPNAPPVDAGNDEVVCDGDQVTLTATNPDGANISWSGGVDDGVPFTPAVGSQNYTVTAELNGCTSTDQLNVTVNIIPQVDAGIDKEVCEGEQITLTADNPDGANISWNGGINDGVPFNQALGFETYTVEAELNGCFNSDDVEVEVIGNPDFTVSFTDPTECAVADGTITIEGLIPNENYDYQLDNNPVQNETSNGNGEIVITDLLAGNYDELTVTYRGCTVTEIINLTLVDPNAPDINAGNDIFVCDGDNIILEAINPDGANLSWSGGVNDGVPFTQNVGTETYTVTAELDNCISTDELEVTVHPLPNVNAGNDVFVCEGESVILTASGAETYEWDNNVVNGQSFVPTTSGAFTVVGTSSEGCENIDDLTITVEPKVDVSFQNDSIVGCIPTTATFISSVPDSIDNCIWYLGDGSTINSCDSVTYTYNTSGCFDVTLEVTSQNGCVSSNTVTNAVCVEPFPNASFGYNPEEPSDLFNVVNFINNSTNALNYHWTFDSEGNSTEVNPTHEFEAEPGDYEVTLIAFSPLGCTDTITEIINIKEELIFYVPNTITPNQDGQNEIFKPVFTSGFNPQEYSLLIFNRWGEVLFESKDADFGWDATYGVTSNETVKDGTYIWKIDFREKETGRKHTRTGHVNVLK